VTTEAGKAKAGDDAHQPSEGGVCGPSAQLTQCYWQARYDEGSTGWDRGGPSPTLVRWLAAGELRPCRILVPGCGRGHEVVALAGAGFEVTGVDFAESAVEAVQERLAAEGRTAEIVQADLFAYEPVQPFEAIYEQTCLCALPPGRWAGYEQRLARWLVAGGSLVAAFMQTESPDGPPFACRPEAMRQLFAADRWAWPDRLKPVEHPNGLVELTGMLRRT
jgi:hypothetical protein